MDRALHIHISLSSIQGRHSGELERSPGHTAPRVLEGGLDSARAVCDVPRLTHAFLLASPLLATMVEVYGSDLASFVLKGALEYWSSEPLPSMTSLECIHRAVR